jgi:hypothetical protein
METSSGKLRTGTRILGALGQEGAHLILSDVERYKPIANEIASLHADSQPL